ncbi:sporulation integral membrane protein YlbJ [Paenibacillus larvae]
MRIQKIQVHLFGLALCVILLAFLFLVFPSESLRAAVKGVSIWWDVLFPSLFPFFVIAELMLGFGLVHFFGTIFDPMMRPLFRVPGIGGFVMAMGFASGYPVGAKLTAGLWKEKMINREEAERLVSFTTSSDPIFLIGAVSVGFFHDVSLAVILAAAHYGSSLLLGFLMRFHARKADGTPKNKQGDDDKRISSLLFRALKVMHEARTSDGRSLGKLLTDAVVNSLQLMTVVGGLVVFFSVIMEVLISGRLLTVLQHAFGYMLALFHMPVSLSDALMNGLFEVTLGAKAAANDPSPLPLKVAVAAFGLSWAGLSVHAQIVSLLSETTLRYRPFLIARIVHAFLSFGAVLLLWNPLSSLRGQIPAFADGMRSESLLSSWLSYALPASFVIFAATLFCIPLLYCLYRIIKSILLWARHSS